MNTINDHYKRLETQDKERLLAMNGILSAKWHIKSDCLTYFKRSILEKEAKGSSDIDMAVLPYFILIQFVDFFGFTWDNILTNTIPPVE
ncbi:hypothetical protein GCM10028807_17730 [Spirosoma daeguense]